MRSSCSLPASLVASPSLRATPQECLQQYRGPNVTCYAYDPQGTTWSVFFKSVDGSIKVFTRLPSEAECQRMISTLKEDTPAACRQLSGVLFPPYGPVSSCPVPPAPPTPAPPGGAGRLTPEPEAPKGDPAAFRSVTVGPTALEDADKPYLEPRPALKVRTARRSRYPQWQQFTFDPIGTLFAWLAPQDW
jgi:hypothetical protein